MPTDACVFFHECVACHVRVRPRLGDCCVFCSFGSVACPSKQAGSTDCCSAASPIAPSLRARAQLTDVAGTFGAIVAALCCAGTPFIIAAVAAVGLSAVRKDAILWPVMLGSLVVAIWGFWRGYRIHRAWTPLVAGIVGAVSLAVGVIVVHGFPAMPMIYGGAILLIAASVWNIAVRTRCRADASS